MSFYKEITYKRTIMGKLPHGADLLDALTKICLNEKILIGEVTALGAVKKAKVGFYDQSGKTYNFQEINKPLEIVSLIGNISLKNGVPIVHAHISLSDEAAQSFGGHLSAGTEVFACEYIIKEYDGPVFERGFDETTGLPLWKIPEEKN